MKRMPRRVLAVLSLLIAVAVAATFAFSDTQAQKMKKPKMTTIKGTVIDLTCASKGKVMMNSWMNAKSEDHMTPMGKKKMCGKMCLQGGQPAALFDSGKEQIVAVFACNPKATLAAYASEEVEVMGFWAGGKDDKVSTFVPAKIRAKGADDWETCDCATMH